MSTFYSKNRRISRSLYHTDLWIVDCPDGSFFNIHGTSDTLESNHPPDQDQNNAAWKFRNDRANIMSLLPPRQTPRIPAPKLNWNKQSRKWS